jgi:hypothetical protein
VNADLVLSCKRAGTVAGQRERPANCSLQQIEKMMAGCDKIGVKGAAHASFLSQRRNKRNIIHKTRTVLHERQKSSEYIGDKVYLKGNGN